MIPSSWQSFLATATAHRSYILFWIEARDRDDPETIHTLGLWTGDDHQEIDVGGVTRTYYGAQSLLRLPRGITYRSGLEVQMQTLEIGPLTPEVMLMLRGYEPRQAPCEIHIKLDDTNGNQIGPVWRAWKGKVDDVSISVEGGWGEVNTVATLTLAPTSRNGTETIPDTRSDATYKLNQGDRIGRYIAVGGTVRVPWGTEVE